MEELDYRNAKLEFSGQKGDYFGLWIVNLMLSILTLGIYSAWAKVRNTQYLYGHTKIDGQSFKYLATPTQILKGRLIAFALFVGYSILSATSPGLSILLGLAFLIALPWLILQGIRFSLRMTSYRNVRFSFTGTYGGIFVHYLLLPFISVFTLYLLFPWAMQQMHQYTHENIEYGGKKFTLNTKAGTYYYAAFCALMVIIVGAIAISFTIGFSAFSDPNAMVNMGFAKIAGLYIAYFIVFALVAGVVNSIIINHIYSNLVLTDIAKFSANTDTLEVAWLNTTNMLIIIFSFGLATPIAVIRNCHYYCSHIEVEVSSQLDKLENQVTGNDSAIGEETAGMFDTDLSVI